MTDINSLRENAKQLTGLVAKADRLEKEIDGRDGRPKFVFSRVIDYMADNNLDDPTVAYNQMHATELENWQDPSVGVTTDNLSERVHEFFHGKSGETDRPANLRADIPAVKPEREGVTSDNLSQKVDSALGFKEDDN